LRELQRDERAMIPIWDTGRAQPTRHCRNSGSRGRLRIRGDRPLAGSRSGRFAPRCLPKSIHSAASRSGEANSRGAFLRVLHLARSTALGSGGGNREGVSRGRLEPGRGVVSVKGRCDDVPVAVDVVGDRAAREVRLRSHCRLTADWIGRPRSARDPCAGRKASAGILGQVISYSWCGNP